MRIYQVLTEMPDTRPGHTFDRFNIAASSFEEAIRKAKASDFMIEKERIQAVHLLAGESEGR